MKKKIVTGMLLTLFLTGMLTLAFKIQPVGADPGTIYIRADGSIDQPTALISTLDNVTYTFTDNINDSEIVVERDNIVIDGNGYTLQGAGTGYGIDLIGRTYVTVRNTQIKNFQYGVRLWLHSDNNTVSGNTITANSGDGVYIYASSGTTVVDNNITANGGNGIYIYLPLQFNTTISGNNIMANLNGVYVYHSSDNMVSGNDIITNNNFGVILESSSNNTLSDNNITANFYGGVNLISSSGNTISSNNIADNSYYGVDIGDSSMNEFYHNNFNNGTVSQVRSDYPWVVNVWDNGYPSGGNYWSDYTDTDSNKGPDQDIPGSDGIWDHQYVINENNIDRYPFASLYDGTPPTIEIPSRTPSSDVLPDQEVTVAVGVTDDLTGVTNVTLHYTIDDGLNWNSTEMLKNPTTGLYEAIIPGQEYGKTVRFKIEAFDYAGNNQTRDGVETYCIYQIVPEFPSLTILLAFTMATLLLAIVFRKKRTF